MGLALDTFRSAVEGLATHRLLGPRSSPERDAILTEAYHLAKALGAVPLRALQINPEKTRCVLLCEHPGYGRCVLKTVSRLGPRGVANAHVESLRQAHAAGSDLFPELYALGQGYSLERCVEGCTLHQLPAASWNEVDLVAFFAGLRNLGSDAVVAEPFSGEDNVLIAYRFVRRALKAARYAVINVRPWHVAAFAFPARKLSILDLVLSEARAAWLPRSLVFTDLTPANVVRDAATEELLVVDVEHLNEGFFGFDALWLLTMLTRANCPEEVLEAAYAQICSDDFTGARGGERLMRVMFLFLLDVLGGYIGFRHGHRAIRRLRRRVRADLAEAAPAGQLASQFGAAG